MRRGRVVLVALGAMLLVSACSGKTIGASNITDYSATLNATASCDRGQTCTWYWEYWKAGQPRSSTSIRTQVFGPVNGPTGTIVLSSRVTGLAGGTKYDWVFCGSPNDGATYECVGPHGTPSGPNDDPPADYASFTTAPSRTLAEAWNGTSWTTQATPDQASAPANVLNGVACTSTAACIAVGSYQNGFGTLTQLAERWNGTSWTVQTLAGLPAGTTSSVLNGVSCTSSTACTAVGEYRNGGAYHTLAERWNGTAWTIQNPTAPGGSTFSELLGVSCGAATACTAVGDYDTSDSQYMLAEAWDGTSWTVQPIADDSGGEFGDMLQGVSCTSATACTAVGTYSRPDDFYPRAERWDGTTWTAELVPTPSLSGFNTLQGVSCTSSRACDAVGSSVGGSAEPTPLAEQWDGANWSVAPTSSPAGADSTDLSGVSCTSATACTAVGDYGRSDGTLGTLAEHWDGTSWTIQASPSPAGQPALRGVSCTSSTVCTAVGDS